MTDIIHCPKPAIHQVPLPTLNGLSISSEAAVQRLAGNPVRDTLLVNNTPIDYLDFASPVSGLGGKMGLDVTNKWLGETQCECGHRS
jgi:hypothetical protein